MPPPPGVTFTPLPLRAVGAGVRAGVRVGVPAPVGGRPPQPTRRELPCVHEGPVVTSCPFGNEALHVRHCMHPKADWDTCSRGHAADANRSCLDCPTEYYKAPVAPPPIALPPDAFTRHLIYHVYPVGGNGAWQRNVAALVERLRLFDGKKIVSIAVDPPAGRKPDPAGPCPPDQARHYAACDPPEAVVAAFGDRAADVEFIVTENDPELREVKTLLPMLERLPGGPGDVALYAQAKGTTRRPGHPAHHWADVQHIVYLDYWPLVEEQLRTYPVTGAFKKLGSGWRPEQAKSDWHYSGSWFWVRLADLFARDWRRVDQFWSGIEPYPSQQFMAAEAGCLFHTARVPEMNLYRPAYWRKVVDPAFAAWRAANGRHFNETVGV